MIHLILVLALIGFLTWIVVTYVPMPDPIKKAIIVIRGRGNGSLCHLVAGLRFPAAELPAVRLVLRVKPMNLNQLNTPGGRILIFSLTLVGAAVCFYFKMPDAQMIALAAWTGLLREMGSPNP